MLLKNKLIILMAIAVLSFGKIYAQGGSNYSVFGLGDLIKSTGASYESLCGVSAAFRQDAGINTLNPAMWSFTTMSRLQLGYRFNQNLIQSGNSSLLQNNGKLNGIAAIFMIDTGMGIAASFGIIPHTWINYFTANPIERESGEIPIKGKALYDGQGGISKAYLGGSVKLTNELSIGTAVFANFGSIIHNRRTEFYDTYTSNYYVRETDYVKGLGLQSGIYFSPFDNVALGAYLENHFGMDYERELRYSVQRNIDTIFNSEGNITMPPKIGFGAAYYWDKFILGADFSMQNFSDFNYRPGVNTKFRENINIALAVERIGNKNINADYLDKISYKFGIGYNQLYYSVYGESIAEYSAAVGLGIPLPGTGMLNTALIFGTRGTESAGLVKEYFTRFTVDLSIGEIWFKPFRRDY